MVWSYIVLGSMNDPNIQYDNMPRNSYMLAAWSFSVRNHSPKTVKPCTYNYNVTIHAGKHFLCVYSYACSV